MAEFQNVLNSLILLSFQASAHSYSHRNQLVQFIQIRDTSFRCFLDSWDSNSGLFAGQHHIFPSDLMGKWTILSGTVVTHISEEEISFNYLNTKTSQTDIVLTIMDDCLLCCFCHFENEQVQYHVWPHGSDKAFQWLLWDVLPLLYILHWLMGRKIPIYLLTNLYVHHGGGEIMVCRGISANHLHTSLS